MTEQTTLGRRAGSDGIAGGIAEFARAQAVLADKAMGDSLARPRHIAALNTFAQFVLGRGMKDPCIYSLWVILIRADGDKYVPGQNQRELFAQLGTDRAAPLPETTLNELVGAAIDDLFRSEGNKVQSLQLERDQAVTKLEASEEAREKAETEATKVAELTDERDAALASSAGLEEQLTHLRAMLPNEVTGEAKASEPRRTRVPDHTGVYEKDTPDGTLYEINWQEDGKTRWKRIGPDLNEAITARAALTNTPEAVTA